MSKPKARTVWCLERDYRFYRAYPTWTHANYDMRTFLPGSKHNWRIRRAALTIDPPKKKLIPAKHWKRKP